MDKVTVVERPGIEHKSVFGRIKKEKPVTVVARDMFKNGEECLYSDGQSLYCIKGDCRSCHVPLSFVMQEGHSYTDLDFEDKERKVIELEKAVASLEREKAALHEQLARMEAKHESG